MNNIKEMLDELSKEVDMLLSENRELKERLRKYEETEKFETAEEKKLVNNEELYKLGDSLINHSTNDEVQVITKLMTYWRDNTTKSGAPTTVITRVLSSQCLSKRALEAICDFIVAGSEKYLGKLGKEKKVPEKYAKLIVAVLGSKELSHENVESLLDFYYERYYSKTCTCFVYTTRHKALYESFMSSKKYKVTVSGIRFYIGKK